jgi:hypothetical protein
MVGFVDLPSDIHFLIVSHASLPVLATLLRTCRKLNQLSSHDDIWKNIAFRYMTATEHVKNDPKGSVKAWLSLNLDQGYTSLHRFVANTIGPGKFQGLPVLELPHTRDYIDWIETNNLSGPITRGIDFCRRPFIALRYMKGTDPQIKAITVFQRYTDSDRPWCNGTCYGNECFLDRCMYEEWITKMEKMLLGQPCEDGSRLV